MRFISVFIVFLILSCLFVTSATDSQEWKSYPYSFESFTFPRDEGKHSLIPIQWWITKEWWYTSGHLKDDDGNTYGYMVCFFSVGPVMFLITEETNNRFHQDWRLYWPWRTSMSASKLDLSFGDNYFYQIDDQPFVYKLYVTAPNSTLDLTLDAVKPPMPVGDDGLIYFGETGYTYYYTEPRLHANGTLTIDGVTHNVDCIARIDRQWGLWNTSTYDGYEWFAISLDNQMEIEIGKMFEHNTGKPIDSMANIFYENGTYENVDDFRIDYQGYWVSPHTGVTYSSGWNISIPSRSIQLNITPSIADQEMTIYSRFWEGSCTVTGTVGNTPVTGKGYAELMHDYWRKRFNVDLQVPEITYFLCRVYFSN